MLLPQNAFHSLFTVCHDLPARLFPLGLVIALRAVQSYSAKYSAIATCQDSHYVKLVITVMVFQVAEYFFPPNLISSLSCTCSYIFL